MEVIRPQVVCMPSIHSAYSMPSTPTCTIQNTIPTTPSAPTCSVAMCPFNVLGIHPCLSPVNMMH